MKAQNITLQSLEPGLLLYHGSHALFDGFRTYETRFSPGLKIPLQYATKRYHEGYLYEYVVQKRIPEVVHAETPFYLKDVPLVQRALTGKTRYKKKKPDTDLGYRTEWDDMVGEMCEYDGISGFSLLKNENQVMLCQDAVREHLQRLRVFRVTKNNDAYTLKQILPQNDNPSFILKGKAMTLKGGRRKKRASRKHT
jgi:hypothetical protein